MSSLYDQLTRQDGTRIRVDRLASVVAGLLATAVGSGVAGFVRGVFDAFLIGPLTGVAEFLTALFTALRTGLETIRNGTWSALEATLGTFGPFAYWGAVVAVIAGAYLLVEGVELRG